MASSIVLQLTDCDNMATSQLRQASGRAPAPERGTKKNMVSNGIRVGRVYAEPSPDDGARVLVDALWPRGLRKDAARLDDWARDVAPSAGLRTWYQHDPAKFGEFRQRYTAELAGPGPRAALDRIRGLAANGPVTLLTATREVEISNATVLAGFLRESA
jgi:uncharacterized protein YeaO (DUF488 family)